MAKKLRLTDLPTHAEFVAGQLVDEQFRADWERLAPARAVAATVIAYRDDNGLSQAALGEQLGMSQPQVARLEGGHHLPTIDTLTRLSRTLGIEYTLDIRPIDAAAKNVTRKARENAAAAATVNGTSVLLTATR